MTKELRDGLTRGAYWGRAIPSLLAELIIRRWRDAAVYTVFGAISLLLALLNVGGAYVLHFVDYGWPLSAAEFFRQWTFSWSNANLGYPTPIYLGLAPTSGWILILSTAGLTVPEQEVFTLTLFLFVAMTAFAKFCNQFVLGDRAVPGKPVIASIAAVLFVASLGVQISYWLDFLPYGFTGLAAGSVCLYFVTHSLNSYARGARFDGVRFSIGLLFGGLAFATSAPFNVSIALLVLVLPACALAKLPLLSRTLRRSVAFYGLLIAGLLASNLWWTLPVISEPGLLSSVSSVEPIQSNLYLLSVNTSHGSLLGVLSGAFDGAMFNAGTYYPPAEVSIYWAASSLAIIVPAFIFGSMLLPQFRRAPSRGPHTLLTLILLLTASVLAGVHSPLYPTIVQSMRGSFIIAEELRDPFWSLGVFYYAVLALALASASEIVLGQTRMNSHSILGLKTKFLTFISSRVPRAMTSTSKHLTEGSAKPEVKGDPVQPTRLGRNPIVATAAIVAIALVVTPLLLMSAPTFTGDAVPHAPYRARAVVPQYEYDLADFIRQNAPTSYTLLFPGGFIEQNWTHGYDAQDIASFLMPDSLIITQPTTNLTAELYSLISSGQIVYINASPLLEQLDIKYIVIEGEIGGSYPFGFQAPPNYSMILGDLNRTTGLRFAGVIGPDTIYESNQSSSLVTIATSTVPSSSIIDSRIIPKLDLTHEFFNYSQFSTYNPMLSAWSGGIEATANASVKSYIWSRTGPALVIGSLVNFPFIYNTIPLAIDTNYYKYLVINFSTNVNTAIEVYAITTPNITGGLFAPEVQQNMHILGGDPSNLGMGNPVLYGGFRYTSPRGYTVFTDDLQQTLSGVTNKTIYYIAVHMLPLYANGSWLNPLVPVNQWPGTQNLTISQLLLGTDILLPPSSPISPGPQVGFTERNFTHDFFNATLGAPYVTNFTTWRGGIEATANASVKSYIWSRTGPALVIGSLVNFPFIYNTIPLAIDTNYYKYLVINFSTNVNTAIEVYAITTPNITGGLFAPEVQQNMHILGGDPSNLGMGNPVLYGGFRYTSPRGYTVFTDDLQQTLSGVTNKTIYYIAVHMLPLYANGSWLNPLVPVNQWPGTQNLTISQLLLGTDPLAQPLTLRLATTPTRGAEPQEGASDPEWVKATETAPYVVAGTLPAGLVAGRLAVSRESPTQIDVYFEPSNVSSRGSTSAFIVFSQSYSDQWGIEAASGLKGWARYVVDGQLVGFLLTLEPNQSGIAFEIVYGYQSEFSTVGGLSLLAYAGTVLAPLITQFTLVRLSGPGRRSAK